LGKTLAGENPKAARTLLCGQGSRLIPRSPGKLCTISTQRFCLVVSASETNCPSPVVFRAAAGAARKKRFSGQYATTEIGHAASELQKGQRAIWGPCVEIRGHQRAQEVEQLAAASVVRAAKAAEVGRGSAKLQVRVRVRVRVRRPSMSSGKMPRMSSGQPGLQKSVVREVEGRRARIVEGSRSRNVEVRRSRK
jgi:hypothetical protein